MPNQNNNSPIVLFVGRGRMLAVTPMRGGLIILNSVRAHLVPVESMSAAISAAALGLKMIRPEELQSATFLPPSTIALRFADGCEFDLRIESLGMPIDRIDWPTLKASSTGERVFVSDKTGDSVPINAEILRYLVDVKYAAKIDKSIGDQHLTPEEQREAARLAELTRDPRWTEVGDEDDLFE